MCHGRSMNDTPILGDGHPCHPSIIGTSTTIRIFMLGRMTIHLKKSQKESYSNPFISNYPVVI